MLILHISDLHCETYMLEKLLSTDDAKRADIIAFTGDAECDGETVDLLQSINKPVFFVPGNMDDIAVAKIFDRAGMNIDGKVIRQADYAFVGLGGISVISSLETAKEKLSKEKPGKIIVLSHHPPRNGVTDKAKIGVSAGLVELRNFILEYKPVLHMHGHIHESPNYTFIGDTLVVNPGPLKRGRYAIIDVETKKAYLNTLY